MRCLYPKTSFVTPRLTNLKSPVFDMFKINVVLCIYFKYCRIDLRILDLFQKFLYGFYYHFIHSSFDCFLRNLMFQTQAKLLDRMSHAADTEDHLFCGKNPDSVLDLSIGAPGPDILLQLPKLFTEATSERMQGIYCLGSLDILF